MRITAAVSALTLLAAAPAAAQTDDVLFGGWSWRPRDHGSPPAGLGGAYVAVADSVRTADVNPAGLALVPHFEATFGTADRWGGMAYRIRPQTSEGPASRPTEAGAPVPCPPGRRARPWTVALFAEQAVEQRNPVDVVRGPGLSEQGEMIASTEELGASVAKGVFPWLDLGTTLAWRHLRMEGSTALRDAFGAERERLSIAGDANKARVIVGALATIGRSWDPTAFRLGVAYHRDLLSWSVERTRIDIVRGAVADAPALVRIEEPPVLSAGLAWRHSDAWLLTGQVDYIWYDHVRRSLELNGSSRAFRLANGIEPRAGIEMTRPSPSGGYIKVRAGAWRETSGRLATGDAEGGAAAQAFRAARPAFRAAAGVSFLGEFYENAVRFDFDVSQVIVEQRSSISVAGARRYSFAVTVRM